MTTTSNANAITATFTRAEALEEAQYLRQRAAESMIALGDCPESLQWDSEASAMEALADSLAATGWDTPPERQEVYVPAAVWNGNKDGGGGGPMVSVEEARQLGALSINIEEGTATWPQHFWDYSRPATI